MLNYSNNVQVIKIENLIDSIGEEKANNILSNFVCEKNRDIEDFLKNNALNFYKSGIAQTYLFFITNDEFEEPQLAAYLTLANKEMKIPAQNLSNKMKAKLRNYARASKEDEYYHIYAPLIAQLGKNFYNGLDKYISGDDIITYALQQLEIVRSIIGGKITYVECEANEGLLSFYKKYGFEEFNRRKADEAEAVDVGSKEFVQLLRYDKKS